MNTGELFFSMKNQTHVDVNNEEFQKIIIGRFNEKKKSEGLEKAVFAIWNYLATVMSG